MAAFTETRFSYDGVSSDIYGLYLADINAEENEDVTESYSIQRTSLPRRRTQIFYGYDVPDPFTFTITVVSENLEIGAEDRARINKWMIGRNGYKKFKVPDEDYINKYFNCIFTSITYMWNHGVAYGFTAVAECDSRYAYCEPITRTYNVSNGSVIKLNNPSIYGDYIYPLVTITMGEERGNISLISTKDNNREFSWESLAPNEILTINNDTKVISSSLELARLDNFTSKKWLRLVDGVNEFRVDSTVNGINLNIKFPVILRCGA